MDLELQDANAVVIGAAAGIGRAICEEFAAEGARVACADVQESVTSVAGEVASAHGVGTMAAVADATDYAAMQELAVKVKAELGSVDHLVYAAGAGSGKFGFPFWSLEPSDWDRVIRVNLGGAVNAAHAFAPALLESGGGSVAFLASVAGQIGSQTDPPYSAAKAGLINFTQCAAKDFAKYGVRVNAVCPGMVKSRLNRSVWQAWRERQDESRAASSYEEWAGEKVRATVPLGRWQTPGDIASMVVYLASARGVNITGQTINVDGGYVMHW